MAYLIYLIACVLATFWGKVLVLEQDDKKNLVLPPDDPIFEGQRDRLVGFGTTPIPPPPEGGKRYGLYLLASKSCAGSYLNSLYGFKGRFNLALFTKFTLDSHLVNMMTSGSLL